MGEKFSTLKSDIAHINPLPTAIMRYRVTGRLSASILSSSLGNLGTDGPGRPLAPVPRLNYATIRKGYHSTHLEQIPSLGRGT